MSEGKSPAFQFYPKQWLGDNKIIVMDFQARGVHFHLMCLAWQEDVPCTLPNNPEILNRMCGNLSNWASIWKQVEPAWQVNNDGRLVQKGLLSQWRKQKEYSKSRKQNAEKRYKKQVITTPAYAEHVNNICDALQSSSSSSSSEDVKGLQPSRNTGVKHQTAPEKSETEPACSSNDSPEPENSTNNGHGASSNGAPEKPEPEDEMDQPKNDHGPQDERAEVLAFIRFAKPIRAEVCVLEPSAEYEGRTLDNQIRVHGTAGVKACWALYIQIGHSGYQMAKGQKFNIREFMRQIPWLIDKNRKRYGDMRNEFLKREGRVPIGALS